MYQDLVELFGFTHGYNSVKRFVRGVKTKDPRQFDRLEFLPGEDYGKKEVMLRLTHLPLF
jgi:hypothetical protein